MDLLWNVDPIHHHITVWIRTDGVVQLGQVSVVGERDRRPAATDLPAEFVGD